MALKFKLTGFARFFLMMIIVAPAAYFGASYYNGEDPVANLKEMVGMEESTVKKDEPAYIPENAKKESTTAENNNTSLEQLQKRITALENENTKLKRVIKNREQEIRALKNK